MNLPPEIKSAEELTREYFPPTSDGRCVFYADAFHKLVNQRDLAIWNAAVEKAAELMKYRKDGVTLGASNERIRLQQAILTLKQKD